MQVLAIARFKEEEDKTKITEYLEQNHAEIVKLYSTGIVRAFWSRGDRPGTVLMLEVDSIEHAKKLLGELPLVKEHILNFSIFPLEPYQVKDLVPEQEEVIMVYVSAATEKMNDSSLEDILASSRKNNPDDNITGILLFDGGSFLQILEGQKDKVFSLFKKISKDPRHARVAKVLVSRIEKRSFSSWSMGKVGVSEEELKSIEGLNDFFQEGNCLQDVKEKQIKNILEAFKKGKWRQKIQ